MEIYPYCGENAKYFFGVICGTMFAGKTTRLIQLIRRVEIARQTYIVFSHASDTRYVENAIATHTQMSFPCTYVSQASEILNHVNDEEVIIIDEAQHFDDDIVTVCRRLANEGRRVIAVCLSAGFLAEPFGPIAGLLAEAQYVEKHYAVCDFCQSDAIFHIKRHYSDAQFVGGKELYAATCRHCFGVHHYQYIRSVYKHMVSHVRHFPDFNLEHDLLLDHVRRCKDPRCKRLYWRIHGRVRSSESIQWYGPNNHYKTNE